MVNKSREKRKLFSQFMRIFGKVIGLYIISVIVSKCIDVYLINVMAKTLDGIISGNIMYIKSQIMFVLIAVFMAITVAPYLKYISSKSYVKTGLTFDSYVYDTFLRQKIRITEKYDSATLIYRITGDPVDYRSKLLYILGDGFAILVVTIICTVVMIKINLWLALICIMISVVQPLFVAMFKRKLQKIYGEEKKTNEDIAEKEKNIIDNFLFVKVNDLKNVAMKFIEKAYEEAYKVLKKRSAADALMDNFQEGWAIVGKIIICLFSSLFISKGSITLGQCIQLLGLSAILEENFQLTLGKIMKCVVEFPICASRIVELVDDKEEDMLGEEIEKIHSLEMCNICVDFNEKTILRNANMNISQGDTVLLKGENGSGKSTLAKVILGLYPYEGSYRINGINIQQLNLSSLRKCIYMVCQDPVLFNMTVIDNLKFCSKGKPLDEIEGILANLGISSIANKIVGENGCFLSGGQRQKISLARAMLKGAEVTILDEPENGLDEESFQYIKKYFVDRKRTLIIISHSNQWNDMQNLKVVNL